MNNTPDNILIQKIQAGDKLAFDSLFFKYYKPLFSFAYNFCKSATISEEAVQNTFIKIWKNNKNLSLDINVSAILFTYTKNEIIDEIRKQNTRTKHESSVDSEIFLDNEKEISNQSIIKSIIESAINQLPAKAKEIFRLSKQEGLTNKEIANHLKISVKTVENQLTIAYRKMRQYLLPFKNQLNF